MVIYSHQKILVIENQNKERVFELPIDWTKGTDSELVSELSAEQKAIWDEMFVCLTEIEAILHKDAFLVRKNQARPQNETTVAAYLLSEICEYNNPYFIKFSDLDKLGIDQDILDYAKGSKICESWEELVPLVQKHSKNVFTLASISREGSNLYTTPSCVAELAAVLLNVRSGEHFGDFCCGTGSVSFEIKEIAPEAIITGYDSSKDIIAVAKTHNAAAGSSIAFHQRDVFELVEDNGRPLFDKIFANYPFGMRMRDLGAGKTYLELLSKRIPAFSRATSSDWLYNMLMVDLLAERGKAVGIMTNGSTWNMIDTPIRKFFVENGLIECVIALPGRLFYGTNVQTSLIVMSRGNIGVRLVDATDWAQMGRRENTLSEEDIAQIVAATKEDGEKSRLLSVEELRENNYVLNIKRYLSGNISIENGVEFGELITKIGRGLQLNARELDELTSVAPTNLQYLSLSNIQNGIIEKTLPYLENANPRFERYLLKNHCLILSKSGFPYRVAVAETEEDQNILVSGNLYIIELDTEKVNPYYLAAYLSSDEGGAALKAISVGAVLLNIGVEQLKKMMIPLPPLEKQNKIAEEYLAARDEIALLQMKLEKAKSRLTHVFEEEGD